MTQTANRGYPLVDPKQPQKEGVEAVNTSLTAVDADVKALMTDMARKANAADIGPAIKAAIDAVVGGSPGSLDTLKELADAIASDPNFAATVKRRGNPLAISLGLYPLI